MDGTEQLARVVLSAANRTQAKGSTVRPIVLLAPEVAQELGMELDDDVIVAAEEYLLKRGYVVPANIGIRWGTYTITPAGFSWLDESSPGSSTTDRLRELAEEPQGALETAVEKQERAEQLEQERAPLEAEPRQAEGEAERGKGFWARLFGG